MRGWAVCSGRWGRGALQRGGFDIFGMRGRAHGITARGGVYVRTFHGPGPGRRGWFGGDFLREMCGGDGRGVMRITGWCNRGHGCDGGGRGGEGVGRRAVCIYGCVYIGSQSIPMATIVESWLNSHCAYGLLRRSLVLFLRVIWLTGHFALCALRHRLTTTTHTTAIL